MSTKPATLPAWAHTGAVVKTPPTAKQAVGWAKGERPPAGFKNWLAYWTYKWAEYLNDGEMQGDFTFDSSVTAEHLVSQQVDQIGVAEYQPLYAAKLNNGADLLHRSIIDRYGYRMGHVATWEFHQDTNLWTTTGTTGTVSWGQVPKANMPTGYTRLACASGETAIAYYEDRPAYFSQDVVYVQEWDVLIGTPLDVGGANDAQFTLGIHKGNALIASFVGDTNGSANWGAVQGISNEDTGVALTANTRYRMAIAIVGDANHSGADELIHYYINGALVDEKNVAIADGTMGPYLKLINPGGADGYEMDVGRIRACWNLSLDPVEGV